MNTCINEYLLWELCYFDLFVKIDLTQQTSYMWCAAQFGSVNFSKVAGLKLTLLHGCFSRFLNCTNGTKLRNASHILYSHKIDSNLITKKIDMV